jgi:metallophosphoesterase (TIGR00282 family)
LRLLFIGDVFGRPGREAIAATLPDLRRREDIDLVIANGENASHGAGLTVSTAKSLFQSQVDVITSGNHIWQHREASTLLDRESRVLRPLNYPAGVPGRGVATLQVGQTPVLVLNVLGRLFMRPIDDPFRAVDDALAAAGNKTRVVIVDFHAEATSEKRAMGFYLDGRVSAVLGTHTHVPTADAQILPEGTAYVTDVGMAGVRQSVIGMSIEPVIAGFTTLMSHHAQPAEGPVDVNTVIVEINTETGLASSVRRLDYYVE